MTYSIDGTAGLMKRFEALSNGTADRQIIGQFGLLAVQRAKELVPVKTGNLRRTIRIGEVTDHSVDVVAGGTSSVGYAMFVEFGTRPHIIRPKNAKALAWGGDRRLSGTLRSGSSATNFAMVVHHPGTRPHPYLVPGANKALAEVGLSNIVVSVWNKAA